MLHSLETQMKSLLNAWMLLLLITFALPCAADEEKAAPAEDTILGEWHLQTMNGELSPKDDAMRLVFEKDGVAKGHMGEDVETWTYKDDQTAATVTLYRADEDDDEAVPEIVVQLKYSFVDDMLVFSYSEGFEEIKMELTRSAEGTKRHQAMRKKQGDRPGRAQQRQSASAMSQIHQGSAAYSNSKKDMMPTSLGVLLPDGFVSPKYLLTPWSKHEVPEGFDEWEDKKKIDWGNTHAGYVYFSAGKKFTSDSKLIVLLELPPNEKAGMITLLFDDNHTETKPYEDADKLIKKQTGHAISEWMQTTSPGTGEMKLPKEDKAGEDVEDDADTDDVVDE